MPKWTYLVTSIELEDATEAKQSVIMSRWFNNNFGDLGYELVSVTPITLPGGVTSTKAHLIFKKPAQG